MTVYFAGGAHYDFCIDEPILESFWYKRNAVKAMPKASQFFLDSGAFSAFTQDKVINLDDYAAFIKEHKEHIYVASSLDSIGNALETKRLYQELRERDSCQHIIPVFHCREDKKLLVEMLDNTSGYGNPGYIALGGMVPESTSYLYGWLDDLWSNYLTDAEGKPLVKVHGFGLTVGKLIERYPWFSVDSTTWLNGARFGTAIINLGGMHLAHMAISPRNPAAKQSMSSHFDRLIESPQHRDEIMKVIEQSPVTLEAMQEETEALLHFNVWSFKQWEELYGFPETFHAEIQQGLF